MPEVLAAVAGVAGSIGKIAGAASAVSGLVGGGGGSDGGGGGGAGGLPAINVSPANYSVISQKRNARHQENMNRLDNTNSQRDGSPVGLKDALANTSYKSNAFNLEQFNTDWGKKLDAFYTGGA